MEPPVDVWLVIDAAVESDRQYFGTHPDQRTYQRPCRLGEAWPLNVPASTVVEVVQLTWYKRQRWFLDADGKPIAVILDTYLPSDGEHGANMRNLERFRQRGGERRRYAA